ncbi:MAG: DUF2971 domain-containing protein [Lactimicrobium sp.]|jgi:hypothetical protein|uniref:DUF2971 domain-containing protein n=1 Tax=Lactimicrobium sp. TaxID=2563780 RepID=UPI002F3568FA
MKKYLNLDRISENQNLYHYTQCMSAASILKTGVFYATKSSFLNDTNEMDYVSHVAHHVVDRIQEESWRNMLSREIIDTMEEVKRHDTFVLSFSLDRDNITLWSEFGDQTGYNLGFHGTDLISSIDNAQKIYYHGRVIYALSEQEKCIRELLRDELPSKVGMSFEKIMQAGITDPDGREFSVYRKKLQKALNIYALFFKQPEFGAENEYRLIFRNPDKSTIHYREKGGFLLPYIEIRMDQKKRMPLAQIMIAPKNHVDLARKGMVQYLEQLGYDVPVDLSSIKLRY